MIHVSPHSSFAPTRRSLAKGVAWAAPAVTIAAAAPAFAASTISQSTYGNICEIYYGDGTENDQTVTFTFRTCADTGTTIPTGTITWYRFESDKPLPLPSVPNPSYFTMTASQPTSTSVLIKVKITGTAPSIIDGRCAGCASIKATWGSSSQAMATRSTITISEYTGGTSSPAGTPTGALKFRVAKREIGTTGRFAHRYLSKTGQQSCFPATKYGMTFAGSNLNGCGDGNGNNSTSTIYPSGSCYYVAVNSTGCPTPGTTCTQCSSSQCTVTAAPC